MTTLDVIVAFLEREKAHTPYRDTSLGIWAWHGASLTSTGDKLISYETTVAEWRDGRVLITPVKYSRTTSKQCGMLRNACDRWHIATGEL